MAQRGSSTRGDSPQGQETATQIFARVCDGLAIPGVAVGLGRSGDGRLIVQVIDGQDLNRSARAARLSAEVARLGWRYLDIVLTDTDGVAVVLSAPIKTLVEAGFFASFDAVTVVADGLAAAQVAQALTALIPGAQALLLADVAPVAAGVADHLWVLRDPFLPGQSAAIRAKRVTRLKAIGMGEDVAQMLERGALLLPLVEAVARRNLTPLGFYQIIRARRGVRMYRQVMERHLTDRGKQSRVPGFVRGFRQFAARLAAAQPPAPAAAPAAVAPPVPRPAPAVAEQGMPRRPRTRGNVWHLAERDGALIYLSDQYRGQVMGYEERGGLTLGQTADIAIGMISIGGPGIVRPLPERFTYHLTDETLSPDIALWGAQSHAVLTLMAKRQAHLALPSIIALSAHRPGLTEAEAQVDGPIVADVLSRIAVARERLADWGKHLFIDRIRLDLMHGHLGLSEAEATLRYPRQIAAIRRAIAIAADQNSLPTVVVSQGCGTRTDGAQGTILAEGRLDVMNPSLGLVVATPTYPFRLMPETVATLDAADQMLVDEIEALAVAEIQAGRRWYCPTLRQVFLRGTMLVADFATMSPLQLTDGPHGFRLEGCTNGVSIISAEAQGERVLLTMDGKPQGDDLHLAYAWGHTQATPQDDEPANHGAVRDSWAADSLGQPGRQLYRYALAARLPVMPSDLL